MTKIRDLRPMDDGVVWNGGKWAVVDYANRHGAAPTYVQLGFRTKADAERWIKDHREEQEA